jgi:hypothetical protein
MQQSKERQSEEKIEENPFNILSTSSLSSIILAVITALLFGVIYWILPQRLTIVPNWLPLTVEIILLLPITIALLIQQPLPYRGIRIIISTVLSIITLILITGVILLVVTLPDRNTKQASDLLSAGALLYISNILIFALWYWEIDGGGPKKRHISGYQAADFQFPQQINGNPNRWQSHFIDYIFLAFTASTAISPADTMPLTRTAKCLMMIQGIIALTILAILIGRSINIL